MNVTNHLRELEENLLDPNLRKDAQKVMALLAEDFREFGSSGRVFNRKEIVQELSTEEGAAVTIDDFEVTMIAADVALATYTANRHAGTTMRSRRSSLWVLREGRWQMLFHQGTRLPE